MAFTKKLVVYDSHLAALARVADPLPQVAAKDWKKDTRWQPLESVGLKYEIQLTDEAYATLQAAPLVKAIIQEKVIDLVKGFARADLLPIAKKGVAPAIATTQANAALKRHEGEVAAIVAAALDRHAEMNSAWRDYYKKQRKELIFCAVGLALTIASTALAVPSGGASIAMSVIGGARVIASTVNKIAECWRDVDQQAARIDKSIHALLAAYQKSVHAGRAVQIGAAVTDSIGLLPLVEVIPFVNRQLVPSMSKINGDMEVLKGKCGNLYDLANRLAAEVFQLLDKIEDWKKANPGLDYLQTIPGLDKLEKRLNKLLEGGVKEWKFRNSFTVSTAFAKYQDGMNRYTVFHGVQQQINGIEKHPRAVEIVGGLIKILGNLAFAGGAYATGVELDAGVKIAGLTTTIINDTSATVKELVEFGQMAKGPGPDNSQPAAQQFAAQTVVRPIRPPRPPMTAPQLAASLPPSRQPPPLPPRPGMGTPAPTHAPPPIPGRMGTPAPTHAPPPIPGQRSTPPFPAAPPPIPGRPALVRQTGSQLPNSAGDEAGRPGGAPPIRRPGMPGFPPPIPPRNRP